MLDVCGRVHILIINSDLRVTPCTRYGKGQPEWHKNNMLDVCGRVHILITNSDLCFTQCARYGTMTV